MNNAIYMALVQAQKEMGAVEKDRKGAKGGYASLPTLCEHVEKTLNKYEILVSQGSQNLGGEEWFYTRLIHAPTGQMLESTCKMFVGEGGSFNSIQQEYGKSMTYLRRYHLMSILGIAADDEVDNDGELSTGCINAKQLSLVMARLGQLAGDKQAKLTDWILKKYAIDQLAKLPWRSMDEVLATIDKAKST